MTPRFYVVAEDNAVIVVDGRTGAVVETVRFHECLGDYGGCARALAQAERVADALNAQHEAGTLPGEQ